MEVIFHITLGLLGLSFIVLIHELGHFIAAKCCKVHVERLSLFLGKPLLSWRWGGTEFAIGWLPLGGYCKMKNESLAIQDWGAKQGQPAAGLPTAESPTTGLPTAESPETAANDTQIGGKSFGELTALQKIFIAAAGPLSNILFAFFVLFSFQLGGYPELQHSNRVVVPDTKLLADPQLLPQIPSPAERAGLRSGDVIVRVGGKKIASFADLKLAVAMSASENLSLEYRRDAQLLRSELRPAANAEGLGWIGVVPWQDLVLQKVPTGQTRVRPGMRLEKIAGQSVANWYEMLQVLRNFGTEENILLHWSSAAGKELLPQNWLVADLAGLEFSRATWLHSSNIWQALLVSWQKLQEMFSIQIKGWSQLLRGRLKLKDNLSGPLQISDQIGQIMTAADSNFIQRWYGSWIFLSFISFMIALANLLPLAVLDGGQILLYSTELLLRRNLPARLVTIYQSVGGLVVIGLMLVVLGFELVHYIF